MDTDASPACQTQRVFLALWPDERVRAQLGHHTKQWTWPTGCAVYAPADWHVTLHFIGRAPVQQVAHVLAQANLPCPPFELVLDQPQLWPRGLAVLCATEVPQPLQRLHDQLGNLLHAADLPVESRPYQPHVTLARHAGSASPPANTPPVVWTVQNYALAASTGDATERYRVLHRYP